ncbi:hypothetical protein HD806DRAFT_546025 [Xylariaceae sp. AK1471]|nr:hypothetical protein HD806DRAFT_546025 [Xylariaceae sp. AK1471]
MPSDIPSDTTPLLGSSSREQAPQGDSHPITLRACHSPWRAINQKALFAIRTILASYLTSVAGVALKYKLETEDDHTSWRIPFQFSTVSFILQWVYHLVVLIWTGMHTFEPNIAEPHENCRVSVMRVQMARFFSPPHRVTNTERLSFSMFYTISHVFTLLNALLYWAVLVPAGHGGFLVPKVPHHHHTPGNSTATFYDPNKGLFEEDGIKPFSILNIWSITAIIAFFEMVLLNSIRRQNPVAGHVVGTMVASGLYLAWAGIGKLTTGHWGLFFLDPKLMGNDPAAAVTAAVAFILVSPCVFTYVYGLIAMRESITAAQ